jgi:hypothetical protein
MTNDALFVFYTLLFSSYFQNFLDASKANFGLAVKAFVQVSNLKIIGAVMAF